MLGALSVLLGGVQKLSQAFFSLRWAAGSFFKMYCWFGKFAKHSLRPTEQPDEFQKLTHVCHRTYPLCNSSLQLLGSWICLVFTNEQRPTLLTMGSTRLEWFGQQKRPANLQVAFGKHLVRWHCPTKKKRMEIGQGTSQHCQPNVSSRSLHEWPASTTKTSPDSSGHVIQLQHPCVVPHTGPLQSKWGVLQPRSTQGDGSCDNKAKHFL